jgi:hypothetical protein
VTPAVCDKCGSRKGGPTRYALQMQNQSLTHDLAAAESALRALLRAGGDGAEHQWLIHRHDAHRHRWRADCYEQQLRDAGLTPRHTDPPALPALLDPESPRVRKWLDDIHRAKETP